MVKGMVVVMVMVMVEAKGVVVVGKCVKNMILRRKY